MVSLNHPDPPEPQDASASGSSMVAVLTRELLSAALGVLGVYVSTKIIKRILDPNADSRDRSRARREAIVSRLLHTGVPAEALKTMSPSEEVLLGDLVFPEDISSSFESVGGLSETKETLRELIIYPLIYPDVYAQPSSSSLLAPPKGVLLYGPPGTGKTLLAKALAKESGANFLALSPSSLLSKWFGDTEALARAVFSLARRVQPTIIFIDEIDGLFRERSSQEHEAHKNLKAEFMQLWDGLTTDEGRVIVLGATNRPYDVDPAILRRMPRPFEVPLPGPPQRADILRKILSEVDLAEPFDYDMVARVTEGYSGSDLKELCRAAMMHPVREGVRKAASERRAGLGSASTQRRLRSLTLNDVLSARREVSTTQHQSEEYKAKVEAQARAAEGERVMMDAANADDAMAMIMRMMQGLQGRGGAGGGGPTANGGGGAGIP